MKKTKNVIIMITITTGALHHTGIHPGSISQKPTMKPATKKKAKGKKKK